VYFLMMGLLAAPAPAQFRDDFSAGALLSDSSGRTGWATATGDGAAKIELQPGDNCATVHVDATADRRNLWWAILRREVTTALDLAEAARPDRELRIEARVRTSHAPRRINLHFNTQRTTDFHSHLMEYDLGEARVWTTVSMTTRGFDVRPGDTVAAQLALMDWGLGHYALDVDYVRVDVVDTASAAPDLGSPQPYHPPVPDLRRLRERAVAVADATVDQGEPETNLSDWADFSEGQAVPVLAVNGTQVALLRFDFSAHRGRTADGAGVLVLSTAHVQRPATRTADFAQVRVVEQVGGAANWAEEQVTWATLLAGQPVEDVINGQMIVDVVLADERGGQTRVVLPRPVLQRLIDGRTHGLVLRPLGSIAAAIYAREFAAGAQAATVHFNTRD
jgi:hypothetical protein